MTQPGMSNGIDPTIAKRFVGDIERHLDALLSERGIYMAKCKDIRGLIKETKDRAADAGISRKSLNTLLKERDLRKKMEALYDGEDGEELEEQVDLLKHALGELGDLPLGKAAVEKAEARKAAKSAAIDGLLDDPAQERVADNVRKLKSGIRELNS